LFRALNVSKRNQSWRARFYWSILARLSTGFD